MIYVPQKIDMNPNDKGISNLPVNPTFFLQLKHLFFFFFPLCPSGFSEPSEPSPIAAFSPPSALEAEAAASKGSDSDSFL